MQLKRFDFCFSKVETTFHFVNWQRINVIVCAESNILQCVLQKMQILCFSRNRDGPWRGKIWLLSGLEDHFESELVCSYYNFCNHFSCQLFLIRAWIGGFYRDNPLTNQLETLQVSLWCQIIDIEGFRSNDSLHLIGSHLWSIRGQMYWWRK